MQIIYTGNISKLHKHFQFIGISFANDVNSETIAWSHAGMTVMEMSC